MAKRKINCSINDCIVEHLKKQKYEKTLRLFEKECGSMKETSKSYEKFMEYLLAKEIEKENRNEIDDLGFEINFGAYESETKLPTLSVKTKNGKKRKSGNEKMDKKEKKIQNLKFEENS